MPAQLKLTPSESLAISRSSPEELEVIATYGAGGSPPPKHSHPRQDEHFEVLAGAIHTRIDGEERVLGEGEQVDIPRGAVHQMWNPGTEPARVLWRTTPGGRTEQWFRSVDALNRSERVGRKGTPSPLAFAV